MNPDESTACSSSTRRPALIYTIPSFHNPTGWTMTLAAAAAPARARRPGRAWCRLQGMLLVEDDSYALTRFEGEARARALRPLGEGTLYSSSFSTTIAPGLRVGWLVLPEGLADDIAADAADSYITPSLLSQATVFEFITPRQLRAPSRRLRAAAEAAPRRDAGRDRAAHARGALLAARRAATSSGSSCPASPTAAPCSSAREGVTAVAGTAFSAMSSWLRLSYAASAPDEIDGRHRAPRGGPVVSLRSLRSAWRRGLQSRCRNQARQRKGHVETPRPQNHRRHRARRRSPRALRGTSPAAVSSTIHAYFDADGHLMFTYLDGTQVSGTIPPGTYTVIYDNLGADDLAVDHAFHLSGPGINFAPPATVVQSTFNVTFTANSTYTLQDDLHPNLERRTFVASTSGGGSDTPTVATPATTHEVVHQGRLERHRRRRPGQPAELPLRGTLTGAISRHREADPALQGQGRGLAQVRQVQVHDRRPDAEARVQGAAAQEGAVTVTGRQVRRQAHGDRAARSRASGGSSPARARRSTSSSSSSPSAQAFLSRIEAAEGPPYPGRTVLCVPELPARARTREMEGRIGEQVEDQGERSRAQRDREP